MWVYVGGVVCALLGFAPYGAVMYLAFYAQHKLNMVLGIMSVILSFTTLGTSLLIFWGFYAQSLVQFGIALIASFGTCVFLSLIAVFVSFFR